MMLPRWGKNSSRVFIGCNPLRKLQYRPLVSKEENFEKVARATGGFNEVIPIERFRDVGNLFSISSYPAVDIIVDVSLYLGTAESLEK